MAILIPLLLINLILLIGIGMIGQENPLDLKVVLLLALANIVLLVSTAVMTHQDPLKALGELGNKLLPFGLCVGTALALLLIIAWPGGKRSGS